MKLTFSTLICPEYSGKELNSLCDRFVFSGVELRTGSDNALLDDVPIIDVASSLCLFGYNKMQLDEIKQILSDMEKRHIGAIRIFLGNFRRRYDVPARNIDYAGIVKMLRALCTFTKGEIWVETHNEFATGKSLKKLIEDVSCDNLKIIWDVMHPFEDGEQPEKTMEYIGDYIAHVHIKDGKKRKDPIWHDFEYTPLGEGEVPIRDIIKLLKRSGFTGYYSLEWENMWRDELKALNWSVDDILSRYIKFMTEFE
ncbi:MAG: sugar phosphate isomerase/epimerase [Firmicutes bacterium]|nr:sugar phosphate isomerase/epimerase [Bacillota bacterium]